MIKLIESTLKSWLIFTVLLVCACSSGQADEFDSQGVKIHYTVSGQGKPVILVHGLYSSAMMNWQMPGTIAQLSKHYQVIALDNRGHGQSDKPTGNGDYGDQMVEDVVRLMNHLHIAKAEVVGYSLGGFIVMKMLTTHPERIDAAVLCGAAWIKQGSPLDLLWANMPMRSGRQPVPAACVHGVSQLATSETQVKAIKVPVTLIVGDRDPCRKMYVEPVHLIRPDWPEYLIADAGHLNCIIKPEFKVRLEAALAH